MQDKTRPAYGFCHCLPSLIHRPIRSLPLHAFTGLVSLTLKLPRGLDRGDKIFRAIHVLVFQLPTLVIPRGVIETRPHDLVSTVVRRLHEASYVVPKLLAKNPMRLIAVRPHCVRATRKTEAPSRRA